MAEKARKRRVTTKQKASTLFHLWHNLRDIKAEAEELQDAEFVLLVGMVELLVEERIANLSGHTAPLAAADTSAYPH